MIATRPTCARRLMVDGADTIAAEPTATGGQPDGWGWDWQQWRQRPRA